MQMITRLLESTEGECRGYIMAVLDDMRVPYVRTEDFIATNFDIENAPLICAHTDTVGEVPNVIQDGKLLSTSFGRCLGADDRAGVFIALKMLELGTKSPFNYAFFSGEERGAIGSNAFARQIDLSAYSAFIGLDRKQNYGCGKEKTTTGRNFAHYDIESPEFQQLFIDKGYKAERGSFSDCGVLATAAKRACVNLSVGYTGEHTAKETLDLSEMCHTLQMLRTIDIPQKIYEGKKKVYVYTPYVYKGEKDDYYGDGFGRYGRFDRWGIGWDGEYEDDKAVSQDEKDLDERVARIRRIVREEQAKNEAEDMDVCDCCNAIVPVSTLQDVGGTSFFCTECIEALEDAAAADRVAKKIKEAEEKEKAEKQEDAVGGIQ